MTYIIDSEPGTLAHYGVLRKSGRYPWGSGENAYQRVKDFNDLRKKLARDGMSDAQIAKEFGFKSSHEYREWRAIADAEQVSQEASRCRTYKEKGWSNQAIANKLGLTEATVRNRLKPEADAKAKQLSNTISTLRQQIEDKTYLDVSSGTEVGMGVSEDTKKAALRALRAEGYEVHLYKQRNIDRKELTDIHVAVPPGVTWADVHNNRMKIAAFSGSVEENVNTPSGWVKPLAIDPSRVQVKFVEDGGAKSDGLIELRPGVEDLSMGGNVYSQVRIQVGDRHYAKGVAVYSDDLPDGCDVLVYSNKSKSKGKLGALKELNTREDGSVDEENPFGSHIRRQIKSADNTRAISALNILNEESTWDEWSKNLPAQVLSKQSTQLARTQLDITYQNKKDDLDEILSIPNATVRKHLLGVYSDEADSAAVHLKAAAMPGQKTHVILPVNSLKDNEIYAPNFKNGDRVALIRFPHAGTFEIPELIVNNKNVEAEKMMGKPKAAVGINHKVAEKLSGADFDGDTVVVIPNNDGRIFSRGSLPGLKDYDPKNIYSPPSDYDPKLVAAGKQKQPYRMMKKEEIEMEMGLITNLVTDMQLLGANDDEVARAVRHSMTVIDAHKHKLDYIRSSNDNGIIELRKKYQGGAQGGANTIISRASGSIQVNERKARPTIDPATGKLIFEETGATKYVKNKKTGEWEDSGELKKVNSTRMAETDDAYSLTSGTNNEMEHIYANHANRLKGLANNARKEYLKTGNHIYSPDAARTYAKEVASLEDKLTDALGNAPREREAQRLALRMRDSAIFDNPRLATDEGREELQKLERRYLVTARERVGSKKPMIIPTEAEWAAIEAGAISHSRLKTILKNTDTAALRELATPRQTNELSPSRVALLKSLSANGYTAGDIAERLGVSASTVNKYL